MLARLDQIKGVTKSYSNYSGTLLRIDTSTDAPDELLVSIQEELSSLGRKPTALAATDRDSVLTDESWRGATGVRVLTVIEFGTFALRWFAKPTVFVPLIVAAVCLYWQRRRLKDVRPSG